MTVALREGVAAAARRLADEGLLIGTAGNVSAREGDLVRALPWLPGSRGSSARAL